MFKSFNSLIYKVVSILVLSSIYEEKKNLFSWLHILPSQLEMFVLGRQCSLLDLKPYACVSYHHYGKAEDEADYCITDRAYSKLYFCDIYITTFLRSSHPLDSLFSYCFFKQYDIFYYYCSWNSPCAYYANLKFDPPYRVYTEHIGRREYSICSHKFNNL